MSPKAGTWPCGAQAPGKQKGWAAGTLRLPNPSCTSWMSIHRLAPCTQVPARHRALNSTCGPFPRAGPTPHTRSSHGVNPRASTGPCPPAHPCGPGIWLSSVNECHHGCLFPARQGALWAGGHSFRRPDLAPRLEVEHHCPQPSRIQPPLRKPQRRGSPGSPGQLLPLIC